MPSCAYLGKDTAARFSSEVRALRNGISLVSILTDASICVFGI